MCGQYFMIVNLSKKEFITPYKMASGAKLWEILANNVPTSVLGFLLRQSNEGGGGDFHDTTYQENKRKFCGRWAGDKIAIIGDYDESNIYQKCIDKTELKRHNDWLTKNNRQDEILKVQDLYKDITNKVLVEYNKFIELPERQIDIKSGDTVEETKHRMCPDFLLSSKGMVTEPKI